MFFSTIFSLKLLPHIDLPFKQLHNYSMESSIVTTCTVQVATHHKCISFGISFFQAYKSLEGKRFPEFPCVSLSLIHTYNLAPRTPSPVHFRTSNITFSITLPSTPLTSSGFYVLLHRTSTYLLTTDALTPGENRSIVKSFLFTPDQISKESPHV